MLAAGYYRSWMRASFSLAIILLLCGYHCQIGAASAQTPDWTRRHEAGRCAIRGQCGKKSFFGGELPCPDNGVAREPGGRTREKLVAVCGRKWDEGAICCDEDQVGIMRVVFWHGG